MPFSFIPTGSVPSTPSGSGSTDALELKIVTVGNPNFANYASIDVDAYLSKPPEPAVEASNPPSAIYSFAQFTWGFAVTGPYNLAAGLYQVARHPIQTVRGLANAVMHPVQTAKAIYQDVKEKAGTSQGRGELTFDVAISAVAYLKIARVTEAAKALETIDDVSDGAKAVAKAGKNTAKSAKESPKTPPARAQSNPKMGRFDIEHANYDSALESARKNTGNLGPRTQKMYAPRTGTLIGERSADGLRGWRIDSDHVNWWDWTDGKKGTGGKYGHDFFPQNQTGPHSEFRHYAEWE